VNFAEPISELRRQLEAGYQKILDERQTVLSDLKVSLERRLQEWASPAASVELKWHFDSEKSISVQEPLARIFLGEDGFLGDVARLGHGIQRSFIVSILQELAEMGTAEQPRLLLGIEEPELYQHPPQARHIASLLERLASDDKKNTQVVLCTHSPYFVSAMSFEQVRYVRKRHLESRAEVFRATYASVEKRLAAALKQAPRPPSVLLSKVNQIMQPSQREIFFCKVAVLVEGPEDVAYLATHIELSKRLEDWRRLGCHFIMSCGKDIMSKLHAVGRELQIPVFTMWDGDADAQGERRDQHKLNNECLLRLADEPGADPLPNETVWGKSMVMWKTTIGKEIIEELTEAKWNLSITAQSAPVVFDS
ncbi:MAG TPA: AAA family ATPase, partial [Nitrospiraceae bacterium]|nr:AAA family ATPase [Nitrospiraceae bacterium]